MFTFLIFILKTNKSHCSDLNQYISLQGLKYLTSKSIDYLKDIEILHDSKVSYYFQIILRSYFN